MARLARVVIVDVPHQVTLRGNARQVIFSSDLERSTDLEQVGVCWASAAVCRKVVMTLGDRPLRN